MTDGRKVWFIASLALVALALGMIGSGYFETGAHGNPSDEAVYVVAGVAALNWLAFAGSKT